MSKWFDNTELMDFMPQTYAADILKIRKSIKLLTFILFVIIISFIFWASIAEIAEITRGEGKVVPSGKLKVVDHLEGGIIKDILVKEGDIVKKGQLLLKVDNTSVHAHLSKEKILYYRHMANIQRLKSSINNKSLQLSPELLEKAPLEAQDAQRRFNNYKKLLKNSQNIARQNILAKESERKEFLIKIQEFRKQMKIINKKMRVQIPLVKKKLVPTKELNDLRIQISKVKIELEASKSNLKKAKVILLQNKHKLEKIDLNFKNTLWQELKEVNQLFEQAKTNLISNKDKYSRTEVRSPVNGIIKQILVATKGGVISSGEDLIEIVPMDDQLLIEVQILPKDIAFIKPGLKASIKITAYDYSIYGDLKGEVTRMSADSITDEQGNVFYKVLLKADGFILSKTQKPLIIKPGMVASVDILTGKKTILNYLLKPIIKAADRALTER